MINAILNWWAARQRRIDREILWPAIRSQTSDIYKARQAFLVHAAHDPAWCRLSNDEMIAQIDQLFWESKEKASGL